MRIAGMIGHDNSATPAAADLFNQLPVGARYIEQALGMVADFLMRGEAIRAARVSLDNPALGRRLYVERSRAEREWARGAPLRQRLSYGPATIGLIEVDLDQGSNDAFATQDAMAQLAPPFARYCRRAEVERWSMAEYGVPLAFVGGSPALLAHETALERASLSDLPVLLTGEFGTEKLLSALSIHCLGERARGPLVEVNCAEPRGDPAAWFSAAERGTLFLNGIERLARCHQERLPLYMRSHLGQWLKGPGAGDVRVIASTCEDLVDAAADGRFSRALLAEIDMLNLAVPPLRLRRTDIEPLVDWTLRRNGFDPAQKKSPALIALLQQYDWPENLVELERVIMRLVVMTDGLPIRCSDVQRYAPWIAGPGQGAGSARSGSEAPVSAPGPIEAPDWAQRVFADDQEALGSVHPCLRRALAHLARHYGEPLSIGGLASLSHASASHLGYLFRTELGMSFKMLQARLRILHAQRLLAHRDRLPITELALMLGFADLSHFEKTFRKQVGISPSAYRRAHQGQ